jgi:SAM-dependent methyltransferase
LLPKAAAVLDAGCGGGADAAFFASRGCRVTAFDASPEMVKLCRARGIPARVATLQGLRRVRAFDGIWASAVLLHVPRADIPSVLRRMGRALRPGGWLFASLWLGKGEGWEADERFVARYALREFKGLLATHAALDVVLAWSPPSRRSAVTWIHFLAQRRDCFLQHEKFPANNRGASVRSKDCPRRNPSRRRRRPGGRQQK